MTEERDGSQLLTAFQCGRIADHVCDWDGPHVVYYRNGITMPEELARTFKDFPKGIYGASATCSVCGIDAATALLWDGGDL